MAKPHGDFGDLSRYDVIVEGQGIELGCQDCASVIAAWPYDTEVNLAVLTKIAGQHEADEEAR